MYRTLITFVAMLMICGTVIANEPSEIATDTAKTKAPVEEKTKSKRAVHRLPNYFGRIVNEEQKEKIYNIQDEYAAAIREYREKLANAIKERNQKILAVLTSEQQEKLEEMKQEAIDKRKAKRKAKEAKETAAK